ncbi:MAG TPA: hypothetical protein VFE62_09615, partial [Gemmataceae bacterium]|nr:hypothetical protein [Gemmataceae bacterium]
MNKPLDCVGIDPARQQTGKHDFCAHDTVHVVESGTVTPPIIRSPEEHMQAVIGMLRRAKANNGRMHLLEIEQAL